MEDSILKSTKKTLGVDPDYTVFDQDIIMHINSAFATLNQLGLGPEMGFMITDNTAKWSDFLIDPKSNSVQTYVYLKVRLLFDPPTTSYVIAAFEKQITELEWRLNVRREETNWVDPDPVVILEEG